MPTSKSFGDRFVREFYSSRLHVLFLAALSIVLSDAVFAQQKSPLNRRYIKGPVRVFFTDVGTSAVSPVDADKTGVPDQVEDVAKQIWAARELFCKVLNFQDPIGCERYSRVNCVEVRLRNRKVLGKNGEAFESAQRARSIPEGNKDDRALVMNVATSVVPSRNQTPAHEFFHLIQYGSTYFKNRWYLEGQARWAEHALGTSGLGDVRYDAKGPWPQATPHLKQLVAMTYDAEFVLWNPIAKAADRNGILPRFSDELKTLKYSDGSLVVQDDLLNGHALMREILVELGRLDDIAYSRLNFKEWSEDNQRSQANNPYIYEGIMNALRRQNPGVGRFSAATGAKP